LKRALLNNWFESHLWLVKRFRMKNKFGYLIPFKRRDKSFKACYRYFKYDAVVNDCSYFNYLVLNLKYELKEINNLDNYNSESNDKMSINNKNNQKQNLLDNENLMFLKLLQIFFEKLTLDRNIINVPENFTNESLNKIIDKINFKNFETNLYNISTGDLIGPCKLIILNRNLIIKFNALIANELTTNIFNFKNYLFSYSQKMITFNYTLEIYYSKSLNTYKLLGPRSGSRLFKILNSLSGFENIFVKNSKENFSRSENIDNYFSYKINFEKFLEDLPHGEVLIFKIKRPSTDFKMNEFCFNTFYNKLKQIQVELKDNKSNSDIDMKELKEELKENNENFKEKSKFNIYDFFMELRNLMSNNLNAQYMIDCILDKESINLTDLADQNLFHNNLIKEKVDKMELDKPNQIINNDENLLILQNSISISDQIKNENDHNNYDSEKLVSILNLKKKKIINITQKKHLLRKFISILNTYTERGPLIHRRKMKIEDLNDKIEESLHIKKDKILDYFSLQKKSLQKNLGKIKLDRIANNTITENINNFKIDEIKKILHSQNETFLLIVKNNLICNKNSNNKEASIFQSIPEYNLIFPSGFSADLLRRFHYIETKVIGLKELNYLMTENNQKIFPDDYPNTKAYCDYFKSKALSKIEKYCLFPPSKRINYQKLNNPYPFYAAWDSLANSIQKNNENKNFDFDFDTSKSIIEEVKIKDRDYFEEFNFYSFNKNSVVIENIKNKNNIKNQMEIQFIKDPKQKNLWIPITFEMLGKGNPEYNTLICLPDKRDYEDIYRFLNFPKNRNFDKTKSKMDIDFSKNFIINLINNPLKKDFIIEFEKSKEIKTSVKENISKTDIKNKDFNKEFKTYKDLYDNSSLDKLKYNSSILDFNFNLKVNEEKIKRKIIGFVTSGQYSYTSHKGIGRGFIYLKCFEEILKTKQEIIKKLKNEDPKRLNISDERMFNIFFIRNPGSRNYYFAKFNY